MQNTNLGASPSQTRLAGNSGCLAYTAHATALWHRAAGRVAPGRVQAQADNTPYAPPDPPTTPPFSAAAHHSSRRSGLSARRRDQQLMAVGKINTQDRLVGEGASTRLTTHSTNMQRLMSELSAHTLAWLRACHKALTLLLWWVLYPLHMTPLPSCCQVERAGELEDWIVSMRRRLHKMPELSFQVDRGMEQIE